MDPVFEDVAFLRLGYDDIGVQAHIHVSWLDPRKVRLVTAVGSKKMAVYDDTNVEERIRVHDKAAVPAAAAGGVPGRVGYHRGAVTSPVVAFAAPASYRCQRSGRRRPSPRNTRRGSVRPSIGRTAHRS